jgi:hypothetical protein
MTAGNAMFFPRTIRLDNSDLQVFAKAAGPGEWAISGAFAFADDDAAALTGRRRQAFANGFLGTGSFGWSTFACVAPISPAEFDGVVTAIADHFVAAYGAPGRAAALPQARVEAAFARGLCDHPEGTLLAVSRALTEDGIVERFRTVKAPSSDLHTRIWEIVED